MGSLLELLALKFQVLICLKHWEENFQICSDVLWTWSEIMAGRLDFSLVLHC